MANTKLNTEEQELLEAYESGEFESDLDADGNVCAITFEHASKRTDVSHLDVEGIAA